MASAEKASKDSAQSPAWSRNASPRGHLGQLGGEAAGLAGEHQRAAARRAVFTDGVERGGVGPVGLLGGRAVAPRRR